MADYRVNVPISGVMAEASHQAHCVSEALYGERVTIIGHKDDWAAVRQHHDGYIGYMPIAHLEPLPAQDNEANVPTHWVHQRSTLLFQAPDIKSPVMQRIPFAAQLTLNAPANTPFSQTSCGLFVWHAHCLPVQQAHSSDPIQLARTHFLGTPYRWGGRSPEGADCSGLIQLLARSKGLSIPRDSVDQELAIASVVPAGDYQAGDLVYWPGHTGILTSPDDLLHATAFSLNCLIEPLANVVERAGPISSVRRRF